MKTRLRASVSTLFTGLQRRNISKTISANPKLTLLNSDCHDNSLQLHGIKSLKRSLHGSVNEDDFSELGPPMAQSAGKLMKLATEKRELYGVRTSPSVRLKRQNQNDDSRYTVNTKNVSHSTNSSSIAIEDVPSMVKLSQLTEAISIFGEISGASMRTLPNGLHCYDVEFQSAESRRRAVSAGGITVKSFHLPIRPLHVPVTVTIRIKNISNETADAAIHSICMSFGSLEGLARTKEDAVDAVYSLKDDLDSQSILKKLNDTITGDSRWSAYLLQTDCTPVATTSKEDAKYKLGLQISSHLAEMRRNFFMKKLVAEDLEYLHLALLHLETPSISNPTYRWSC